MSDVFVSYKAEDRPRVEPLVESLEAEGLSVWWDAHVPAVQALSVPQKVPSGAFVALSRHCGAPVVQEIAPFLHGLPGLVEHGAPVAHAMQMPAALHT